MVMVLWFLRLFYVLPTGATWLLAPPPKKQYVYWPDDSANGTAKVVGLRGRDDFHYSATTEICWPVWQKCDDDHKHDLFSRS